MQNQYKTQVTYNIKYPIDILLDWMETRQEFAVAGNLPFSDWQLVDMGVTKILVTKEYKHVYHM